MARDDRSSFPDRSRATGHPWGLKLGASVMLGRLGHIPVRAHVSLLILLAAGLLFDLGTYPLPHRLAGLGWLCVLLALRELARGVASRLFGGYTDRVIFWPLGSLVLPDLPWRWPVYLFTSLSGTLATALLGYVAALILFHHSGQWPALNPSQWHMPVLRGWYGQWLWWWLYVDAFLLTALNLLPIYPLDGGYIAQSLLWPWMGYSKSWDVTTTMGLVVAAALAVAALALANWMLLAVAVGGFYYCHQVRKMLHQPPTGQEAEPTDSPVEQSGPRQHSRSVRRARRLIHRQRQEETLVDAILAKLATSDWQHLSHAEKRRLRQATRRRQRDADSTAGPPAV